MMFPANNPTKNNKLQWRRFCNMILGECNSLYSLMTLSKNWKSLSWIFWRGPWILRFLKTSRRFWLLVAEFNWYWLKNFNSLTNIFLRCNKSKDLGFWKLVVPQAVSNEGNHKSHICIVYLNGIRHTYATKLQKINERLCD